MANKKPKKGINIADFLKNRKSQNIEIEKETPKTDGKQKSNKEHQVKERLPSKLKKQKVKTEQKEEDMNWDYRDFQKPKMFRFIDVSRIRDPLKLLDFIEWLALPPQEREPKNQKELAEKIQIDENTLSNWKKTLRFWDEVAIRRNQNFRKYTSSIYFSLAKKARETGDPRAVELFAKMFEGFTDKIKVEDEPPETEFTPEEKAQIAHALKNVGLASIIKMNQAKPNKIYDE